MAYTYGSTTYAKLAGGTTENAYEVRLGYQVDSQSIANNTSTITLRLEVRSVKSNYGTYGFNQTTTIDGTKLAAKTFDMRSTNTWQIFGTRQITVTHDNTGKYSASKSASFTTDGTGTWTLKSGSASVTVSPITIPRYATSNQSLGSKTSSSITMNWSSDSTIDYIWYSKDNGTNWTAVGSVNATSGSYTISSLSANTAYNIKTRVRRKDSQLTTDSSNLSVTTYSKTTPTISLSSKTINSIVVTSSCNVAVSSTQYRIKTSSGSYGSYQTSATFSGLSANTSYVIEVRKVGTASGEVGTAVLNVTTYNHATISTGGNFNLGDSETVTYSNPSGSTINIGIYTTDGANALAAYRSASGSSYTFSFTDSELDAIYRRLGSNNSTTVRIYLRTTCNGSSYYSTKDVTVTLTGNQKTGHINVDGVWKRTKKWIKVSGTWKRCVRWVNVNGEWKRCI